MFIAVVGLDGPKPDTGDLTCSRPEVPPDQNAFTFFAAATNALVCAENVLARDYLAGRPVDEKLLQEAIARNADMTELLRQGLSCRICLRPHTASSLETPFLRPFQRMATVLALSSRSARLSGNYVKAVDDCLALVRFGDLLQADAESLVDYLLGNGVMGMGLTQAQDLARDPGVSGEKLERLSTVLSSLGPFDRGLVSAVRGDFRISAHMIDALWRGELPPGFKSSSENSAPRRAWKGNMPLLFYFLQPNNTKRLLVAFDRDIIISAPLPYADAKICDTDTFLNLKKNSFLQMARPNTVGRIFLSATLPLLGKGLEHKCRAESNVAATRLLIALHRYRKEKGAWPNDLKALTPDYLASIPADPFDGMPFRYLPERSILYSVGKDLKDSAGSNRPLKASKKYPSSALRWMTEDAVYEIGD